jgi:predicted alpha/beta-hydrolase family hydrolase
MVNFLFSGPENAEAILLLAHGAGAPMDNPWMNEMARGLGERGIRTVRFEFAYMASRRTSAGRKAVPRADLVKSEFLEAVAALPTPGPCLFIGGKSMGGRVASMVAEELYQQSAIAGLVCFGYPFHPPDKPEQLRTAHLKDLTVPALICQGTRDPFGTREEVPGYALSPAIALHWLEDGDHDFRPRKPSGLSFRDNLNAAMDRAAESIKAAIPV